MLNNQKYSAKNLTKTILLMSAVGILIPTIAIAPGLAYALKLLIKEEKYYPSRIKGTLDRLQKQKLISIKEEKELVRIELSERGKKKVLSFKIEELKLNTNRWDKLWRVVIFDIPEYKKSARNFLRAKMKELGFYSLQKSVLVTPWDCKEIIDFIKHFYDVADHVNIIIAKEFEGDEKLKRYFKL